MVPLLGTSDPAPFSVLDGDGMTPLLVVCDHASNTVPRSLGDLGVSDEDRARHIGWDIGARATTERIVAETGACAVLSGYSRLVIDCNRPLWNETLVPTVSDGTAVPANRDLSRTAIAQRVEAIYLPYHLGIAEARGRFAAKGLRPLVLFMHSFTPRMGGRSRPWSIGITHSSDDSVSRPFSASMRRLGGFDVGDDEPYGFAGGYADDYSIVAHAIDRGLKHLFIEVRQDQISDDAGADLWAGRIVAALKELDVV